MKDGITDGNFSGHVLHPSFIASHPLYGDFISARKLTNCTGEIIAIRVLLDVVYHFITWLCFFVGERPSLLERMTDPSGFHLYNHVARCYCVQNAILIKHPGISPMVYKASINTVSTSNVGNSTTLEKAIDVARRRKAIKVLLISQAYHITLGLVVG